MQCSLAISPCPNDTFSFYGVLHGKTSFPGELHCSYMDIEALNLSCVQNKFDFCKVSFNAFLKLTHNFVMLDSGAALGFGCGPLVVSKKRRSPEELKKMTIAIPGRNTTAFLLLTLHSGVELNVIEMPFDHILNAVVNEEVDAGLIIHESRFTYKGLGLNKCIDLGAWWEQKTGAAIPLGGIVAKRSLPKELILEFQDSLAQSIDYAWANQNEVLPFMEMHAQEIETEVMFKHVDLYVNKFTRSLGDAGEDSIQVLMDEVRKAGLIEHSPVEPLFARSL